jgi:cytochrome c peroxidase
MRTQNRFQLTLLLLFGISLGILWACKKEKVGYHPTPYVLEIPSHFPAMPIPADNPMTIEGVELGRKLFYETKLSLDNSISCASCHAPQNAFSDSAQFSKGVNGTLGNRQSMALINLGWQTFFFWDGRAKTLEEQILQPVPNPIEMHQSWEKAVQKLDAEIDYKNDFFKAFGEVGITKEKVSKAIAQFLRTMISGNSRYDIMYKIENGIPLNSSDKQITITPEEWGGYDIFKSLNGADCFHCHNGPLMQVKKFSNNGLDAVFTDVGREEVTGNVNDRGRFKVPTLRNIALSAPYMHDGRFKTLDEVIEHYSSGVVVSPSIDPLIEYANQGGVQLDAEQKMLVKTFLNTLTDYQFINNPKFQKPE